MRTRQKTRIEGKSADSQLHSTINKLEFNIDKTEILRDLKVISSHSIPSNFNENVKTLLFFPQINFLL
jgi:hypothetical protein